MTGALIFSMQVQVGEQQLANLVQAMSLEQHADQLHVFDAAKRPLGQLHLQGATVQHAQHWSETGAEVFVHLLLDRTATRVDAPLDDIPDA